MLIRVEKSVEALSVGVWVCGCVGVWSRSRSRAWSVWSRMVELRVEWSPHSVFDSTLDFNFRPDQCFPVPARHRSVPFRSVLRSRSSSRTERKNGTERNGTISVLGGTERNDENRRNDETGRSVPKFGL